MASAWSNATKPKIIRMLVARKNAASSTSNPFQSCTSNFVPVSIDHVPLLRARVSTNHRYMVGKAIGISVLVVGRLTRNSEDRVHKKRANGPAHTSIKPKYVAFPPLQTNIPPISTHAARNFDPNALWPLLPPLLSPK